MQPHMYLNVDKLQVVLRRHYVSHTHLEMIDTYERVPSFLPVHILISVSTENCFNATSQHYG